MPESMTPAPDAGEQSSEQENWSARYAGLQKVLSKRDTDLATATSALDELRRQHEAAMTELAAFKAAEAAAGEEEAAKAAYEELRQRFEPKFRNPAANPIRDAWSEGSAWADREREEVGTGMHWPR